MSASHIRVNAPDIVKIALDAIDKNSDCQQGIMQQYGYAYTENGVGSDEGQPEFLVLVTASINGAQNYWYGHVLCRKTITGELKWIAVLVRSTYGLIDAKTNHGVLYSFKHIMSELLKWEPPFAQKEDDVKSMHDTFDEAVKALTDKIKRFKLSLRQQDHNEFDREELGNGRYIDYPIIKNPPNSNLDLCYMDIYGFSCHLKDSSTEKEAD